MPKGRVTKRAVDALECPPGKDRAFLWDDALAGFGVAAFASGKKVYVVQYRSNGRSRRATIGDHGRLTPDEARREARKLLGAVETGSDPIEDRRAARAVRTFDQVAEEFLEIHARAKRKARTAEEYRRVLELHVLPALGAKRIVDVKRADVAKIHAKMASTPAVANKVLAIISAAWNWAARRDEVVAGSNPAQGIEFYRIQSRERFLGTEELARLGDALRRGETEGLPWTVDEGKSTARHAPRPENRRIVLDPFAAAAIRLLLFTGARLREILHARWEQVDFERGLLNLPDSKSGKKSIILSAPALAVLASLPRIAGNPHIVPGKTDGQPRTDLKRPWAAVTTAAGLEGMRIHDLRHSFASVGASAGMGLPIVGKLLGHSRPETTARYAHLDADPLRKAADAIAATITDAMAGGRKDDRKSTEMS